MNPELGAEVAEILHLAINGISLILLVPLGVGIVFTVVKTIGVVIENQEK